MNYNLGRIGMNVRGAYSATANYEKLDVVSYNGSSYVAKAACTNVLPTNTEKWELLAKGLVEDSQINTYQPIYLHGGLGGIHLNPGLVTFKKAFNQASGKAYIEQMRQPLTEPGLYIATCNVQFASNGTGYRRVYFNFAGIPAGQCQAAAGGVNRCSCTVMAIVESGDTDKYAQVQIIQNSGSTLAAEIRMDYIRIPLL